jgi:hypothetical protein
MLTIAISIVLVYAVFTGITGTRLLLLASRTRGLPEATLGISYIVGGMLGWAAVLVGGGIIDRAPLLGRVLNGVGLFCFSGGTLTIALFCWRVFAPTSAWAKAFFLFLSATLLVDWVHNIVFLGTPFPPTDTFWYWPGALGRMVILGWRPFAALPYYARLKKRLALGLADPVATNRVFLWGIAGALTFISSLFVLWVTLAGVWTRPERAPAAMVTVFLATSDSLLSWLAFVPPKRYVAWIRARSPEPVV